MASQLAIGGLICLVVAIACLAVASVLALFAKMAASDGGRIGCFVLAVAVLCIVGAALLCATFA